MTSTELRGLYRKTERDAHIFELQDRPGIQIIRTYKNSPEELKGRKMFIKFYLESTDASVYVCGGVDMVKDQAETLTGGWVIENSQKGIFRKFSNFFFWKPEGVIFQKEKKNILFQKHEFTLNEFIDQLEKNHTRDMFRISRISNSVKNCFLHSIFFLVDSRYIRSNYIFTNQTGRKDLSQRKEELGVKEEGDPLFKYFNIHKNLLGVSIVIILVPLAYTSIEINTYDFSVSNPFIIFAGLFFFFIIEKIDLSIIEFICDDDRILKLVRSTFEMKGKLRIL